MVKDIEDKMQDHYAAATAAVNHLAALLRVNGVMLSPDLQKYTQVAAAAAWVLAFLLFIIVYLPIFARARIDGKPG